jgi:AraC-like DNA-binding protein
MSQEHAMSFRMVDAADSNVPSLHLDGARLPPEMRLAAFAQIQSSYSITQLSEGDFEIDARAWLLGELMVTSTRLTAVRIERTPAHVAADGRDTYSFVLLRRGSWTADIEAGHVQVASGQVCVMDFAHDWLVEGTDQDNIMLVVPRRLAKELAPDAPPLHGRLIEGAPGRLLAEHMFSLARYLPDLRVSDLPVVQQATIGVLAATLRGLPQEDPTPCRNLHRDIGSRVLAYIERHLTDDGLSVATICRDVAISRASLYRSFNATSGIANYIQRRRLEAAHALISDEGGKVSMSEIADMHCFSSQAHFSTAFRRMFGYTPVAARNVKANARDVGGVFHDWRKIIADLADAKQKTA